MKQAEGASMAAKNLMGTSDKKGDGKSDEKWANEKEQLLKKLKDAEADRDTMKVQSENLSDEYNRVCDQLQEVF
jgi:hypothetical protein